MNVILRPRRSTTTEWQAINPVLQEGEFAIEAPDTGIGTGLCKFKIGDGHTPWNALPYAFDAVTASAIYGGNAFVSNDITVRSDTDDNWESEDPVLKNGEFALDTTYLGLKIGDGEHHYTELDYIAGGTAKTVDYDFGEVV